MVWELEFELVGNFEFFDLYTSQKFLANIVVVHLKPSTMVICKFDAFIVFFHLGTVFFDSTRPLTQFLSLLLS